MAYINPTIYSNVLAQEVALDLFLPNDKPDRGIIEPQGYYTSFTAWVQRKSVSENIRWLTDMRQIMIWLWFA